MLNCNRLKFEEISFCEIFSADVTVTEAPGLVEDATFSTGGCVKLISASIMQPHFHFRSLSIMGSSLDPTYATYTPRPNTFRTFFQTPKDAKHILVILLRPLTRLKHKIGNLPFF